MSHHDASWHSPALTGPASADLPFSGGFAPALPPAPHIAAEAGQSAPDQLVLAIWAAFQRGDAALADQLLSSLTPHRPDLAAALRRFSEPADRDGGYGSLPWIKPAPQPGAAEPDPALSAAFGLDLSRTMLALSGEGPLRHAAPATAPCGMGRC